MIPITEQEMDDYPGIDIEELDDIVTGSCNHCGTMVPKGDLLCGPCFEEQQAAGFWEACHPEARCPPRE